MTAAAKKQKLKLDQKPDQKLLIEEIERLGKTIRAQIDTAKKYEALAIDKAAVELKKADDNWVTVGQHLAEAQALCKKAGIKFPEFKKKWAPSLARSTVFRIIAAAKGGIAIEDQRKVWREEKAAERAEKKSKTKPASETIPTPSSDRQAEEKQVDQVIAKLPLSWAPPAETPKKPSSAPATKTEAPAPVTKPEATPPSLPRFEEGVGLLRGAMSWPASKFKSTYLPAADLEAVAEFLKAVAAERSKKAAA
jgi:hypothetical protein